MRTIKYYIGAAAVIIFLAIVLNSACRSLPAAKVTLGVYATDFKAPTKSAMGIINGFVGCEFLVPGDEVRVLSTDGQPCGESFHDAIEDGHSAGTYACEKQAPHYEIHVMHPGNTHTQACIVAHEIGHATGLEDHKVRNRRGIMNQYNCPEMIVLSDAEVRFLREKYCK